MNYGRISGVIVDYCRSHGYWLDDGELEKIAKWVATGGLKEKYKLEMEEAQAAASKARFEKVASEAEGQHRVEYTETSRGLRMGTDGFNLIDFVSSLFD
jgi:Zn-finger nucleic acid-binding protein